MHFCYEMPQHMSLTLTKLSVQNGRHQTLFVDAPDKQVHVLDLESLKKHAAVTLPDGEELRCSITVGDKQSDYEEKLQKKDEQLKQFSTLFH